MLLIRLITHIAYLINILFNLGNKLFLAAIFLYKKYFKLKFTCLWQFVEKQIYFNTYNTDLPSLLNKISLNLNFILTYTLGFFLPTVTRLVD